jgi:LmbE family N-acetylglucosaminyl deacetylase
VSGPGVRDVVLAVGAHPDDVEFSCGGTLAALVARGIEVHIAVVTDGWCGSYLLPGPEIAQVRLGEAKLAAEICGASSFTHLGMHDQGSETTIERRRDLVNHIRRLGATVLIGHSPLDYHVDHRNAAQLVSDARCAAGVPNFADEPPLPATPHLAVMDTNLGVAFEPHLWVDVTATWATKRAMLEAHASQLAMEDTLYGAGPVEMMEVLARFRGAQRSARYAEAFRGCETYPEPDGALRFLVRALEGA